MVRVLMVLVKGKLIFNYLIQMGYLNSCYEFISLKINLRSSEKISNNV